jgi:1-acyl-sn-glycerol-3-phosphate acyltransferase
MILMVVLFNKNIPLIMARTIWSPGMLFIAGATLEIKGKENFQIDNPNPVIVVANHTSYMDIPIVCRSIPVNLHFTAKSQIKKMPIFGIYMRSTGMIFIDRSDQKKAIQSINEAAKLIRDGNNVIIYPEGHRSTTGQMAQFKKGAFHLAVKSGADIVPLAIDGAAGVWPKVPFKIQPGRITATFGHRIPASNFGEDRIHEFAKFARSEMEELLGRKAQPV